MIEDNTILGNSNGIFLAPGVQGNTIRRNVILGNPAVQVDVDHPSASGLDIKNLADDGANTFRGNVCQTAVNAPCPAVKRVQPNPQQR
jgi:parallel beta-helix repeat protein